MSGSSFSFNWVQTRREIPSDIRSAGQQLLYRAGYIRRAGGQPVYLPLGQRAIDKLITITRTELSAAGAEKVIFSTDLRPEETLQLTLELVKNEIHSYRQLPTAFYFLNNRSSAAIEPAENHSSTVGLFLDGFTLAASSEALMEQTQVLGSCLQNILKRCQIQTAACQAPGNLSGDTLMETMSTAPFAPETLVSCPACGYAANLEYATIHKQANGDVALLPIERVATPGLKTIEALSQFLKVSPSQTAKVVFLMAEYDVHPGIDSNQSELIFAIVRGDMDVSCHKVCRALGAYRLRPATEPEILASGAVPGYASPVGLSGAKVVVDDLIPLSVNLAAGANEEGYHLLNVNYPRDFQADIITDIATTREGDPCLVCQSPLELLPAYSLASVTHVRSDKAISAGWSYLDASGQSQPVHLAAFRLDLSAVLSVIAEQNHNEQGLCLPRTAAPADIYLMTIPAREINLDEALQKVLARLTACGYTVMVDDRSERAGVKFNDADLIGIPLRLTLSERSLKANALEAKLRSAGELVMVPLDALEDCIKQLLTS